MLSLISSTPLLRELNEIRGSLNLINQEVTILGHSVEGISGATFRISQVLNFNIGSLDKLIDTMNEPEKQPQDKAFDIGLMTLMTIKEKTEYDQISGLRHQVIAQWRVVENRKWELLKTIRNRLKLTSNSGQ